MLEPAGRPGRRRARRAPRVGTRRNTGATDAAARAEGAAQVDLVRLLSLALLVADGRALEADVADPVLRAGVRAAVEVQPERGDVVAEALLELLDQRAEPRLRLGDREVAVRLARCRRSSRRGSGSRRGRTRARRAARRSASTAAFGTFVRTRFCWRVTRTSPPKPLERDRRARAAARRETRPTCTGMPIARQPVLLLRLHAEVVGDWPSSGGQREVGQRVAEARARPRRACPRGRSRRP